MGAVRTAVRCAAAAAVLAAAVVAFPPAASAYPAPNVAFEGRGWGHGRGMGQYGALGYALSHGWTHTRILDHFYGGTEAGAVLDSPMSVRMMRMDGLHTLVQQERGHLKTNAAPGSFAALRAVLVGPNAFRVDRAPGCAGPWEVVVPVVAGPVVFQPEVQSDEREEMLQVCEPVAFRWVRGEVQAVFDAVSGAQRTVNVLPLESYLRGVVPAEVPASWGALGGGAGMHAVRAQAVAARSYAFASNHSAYAKTCDSTACQVYLGRAEQRNGTYRDVESPLTDAAIAGTAGQVRMRGGAVARTEFSSSTGGYTAGGTFPAVPDEGDGVSMNPNHLWKAAVPVAAVEAAWPQIGTLVWLQVTARNGLGDFGGRVTQVKIEGTAGAVTPTGNEVRQKLGLRSDWFRVISPGGYWILGADGGIFSFGNAEFHGSTGGMKLAKPVVGMDATPTRAGYWMVGADGGIFSFGDAEFWGSTGGMKLAQPVIGMAATPAGNGYWLFASDGGIFSFGDAEFWGSTGGMKLAKPVVGMAPTPSGKGYWLVAADGGVFSFGDAEFWGSTGGMRLASPVLGIAATPTGKGYWLYAGDGGIFSFGDAEFQGSTGGMRLNQPIVAMAPTPAGGGYYLLARDGGIFTFGDAAFFGSVPGVAPTSTTAKIDIAVSVR